LNKSRWSKLDTAGTGTGTGTSEDYQDAEIAAMEED